MLVYFAVAKKGEKPTDGKTDVNPEGLTAGVEGVEKCGRWAGNGAAFQCALVCKSNAMLLIFGRVGHAVHTS